MRKLRSKNEGKKSAVNCYGRNSDFAGLCYKEGCYGDLATGCRWFFDILGMGSGYGWRGGALDNGTGILGVLGKGR